MAKYALRAAGLSYLLFLLVLPVGLICWNTFADGVSPVIDSLSSPSALHAFKVTAQVAFFSVVANTVFGVGTAVLLVRHDFPGKRLLNAVIDLSIAVSPVVVGLALILVYGRFAPLGGWLADRGIDIIFSLPGMVLATIFVSLPFVAREVVPTLREIGDEQEQAARTLGANSWQTFWRITLPAIRWAVIYGVILTTARCLGEYGAVAVVSGRLQGETETATLRVEERYESFDLAGAYAISIVLALIAVLVLVAMTAIRPKEEAA